MYKLMMVADKNEDRVIRTMLTQKNAPGNTMTTSRLEAIKYK